MLVNSKLKVTYRLHLANRSSGMYCSLLQCKSMISSIGELPRLSGNVTSRLLLTSINLSFFRLANRLDMKRDYTTSTAGDAVVLTFWVKKKFCFC